MNAFQTQLNQWAISSTKLTLNPEVLAQLGTAAEIAQQHAKVVDVYTFTYNVDGLQVGGFAALPRATGRLCAAVVWAVFKS